MDFKSDLEYATSKLKIEFSFSDYQLKALKSLYDLKDAIAVLLTGSGKSIIFQVVRCFRDLYHDCYFVLNDNKQFANSTPSDYS